MPPLPNHPHHRQAGKQATPKRLRPCTNAPPPGRHTALLSATGIVQGAGLAHACSLGEATVCRQHLQSLSPGSTPATSTHCITARPGTRVAAGSVGQLAVQRGMPGQLDSMCYATDTQTRCMQQQTPCASRPACAGRQVQQQNHHCAAVYSAWWEDQAAARRLLGKQTALLVFARAGDAAVCTPTPHPSQTVQGSVTSPPHSPPHTG